MLATLGSMRHRVARRGSTSAACRCEQPARVVADRHAGGADREPLARAAVAGRRSSGSAPGCDAGTSSTTTLVANVTGRVQRPARNSACASFGLAEANTSAGAPRSICVWSWLEPAKLYVGARVDLRERLAQRRGGVDRRRRLRRGGQREQGGQGEQDESFHGGHLMSRNGRGGGGPATARLARARAAHAGRRRRSTRRSANGWRRGGRRPARGTCRAGAASPDRPRRTRR